MKSETLRRTWALFAGALIFAAAGSAQAQDAGTCLNDIDCPDPQCGGQVCDYNKGPSCVPAGGAKKGADGWCTVATDCKCMAQGATCNGLYCSFTLAKDAPAGGAGGSTGAGGSSATGAGGSASTGSSGSTTAPAPAEDSGGCAIARTPVSGLTSAGLLVGLGAIAFGVRRRQVSQRG